MLFKLLDPEGKFKKDRYYRLDLTSSVQIDDTKNSKLPYKTLSVIFTELSDEYQNLEKIKSLPSTHLFRTKDKSGVHIVEQDSSFEFDIDVTLQRRMASGSIWQNGQIVWQPSECFILSISQLKSGITAYWKEQKNGTKLPYLANKARGTNLIRFPNCIYQGHKVTVLIPCTEVIRYYFLGSDFLTLQLYNGGLNKFGGKESSTVYSYDKKEGTRDCYIWLRRSCEDSDAIFIARALKDPCAHNAMKYVYSSLNAQSKYLKPGEYSLFPKTNLPFADDTSLEVNGQWLALSDKGESTFFVRNIQHCHHEFPLDNLEIESIDSYSGTGAGQPKNNRPIKAFDKEIQNEVPEFSHDNPPNAEINPKELEYYEQCQANISLIKITKVKKASETSKGRYEVMEQESSDGDSTLPGNYQKDNKTQPWNIKVSDSVPIQLSERLRLVSEAICNIENKYSAALKVSSLPEGEVDSSEPYGLYSFQRPPYKSNNYSWNWLENRNRKALFLEIEFSAVQNGTSCQKVYLLEIEGKGKEAYSLYLFKTPVIQGTSFPAKEFLQKIAEHSGSKIISDVFEVYFSEVRSLKHTESENDPFANRLFKAVSSISNA